MKHLPLALLVVVFLPVLFFLGGSIAVLSAGVFLVTQKASPIAVVPDTSVKQRSVYNLFSSPPPVLGSFTSSVSTADARALKLEQFFAKYHSPLSGYGEDFVTAAQKYSLPWQLLPAISMQESLGGTNVPEDCFNPFGWGINSAGTLCFSDWPQAIETVSKGMKERYIDNGLVTVEQIMSKYNPISYHRDGSWGNGVQYFLDEINSFSTP
ncbi:MAG: hypothetical protein M1352_00115 [Patescibacteria group bacterium]|nr:hypothetical protein [Patescibacteria group bacterium]